MKNILIFCMLISFSDNAQTYWPVDDTVRQAEQPRALAFGSFDFANSHVFKVGIRLGEIELDSETAKEYLLDCYNHPLKIGKRDADEEMMRKGPSGYYVDESFRELEREIKAENENAKRNSIYEKDGYYYVPRTPSPRDFVKWVARKRR